MVYTPLLLPVFGPCDLMDLMTCSLAWPWAAHRAGLGVDVLQPHNFAHIIRSCQDSVGVTVDSKQVQVCPEQSYSQTG